MPDLLTPLDVVNQSFRKSLRGYDPGEVDDFLDQVAESLQSHIQKSKDLERTAENMQEQLKEYKEFKDSLQEALLFAQRASEERIRMAQSQADTLLGENTVKCERMLAESANKCEQMTNEALASVTAAKKEVARLHQTRDLYIAEFKGVLAKFSSLIGSSCSDENEKIANFATFTNSQAEPAKSGNDT